MTALEQNAELLRQLSYIAEDEELTAKVLKYIKRLVSASSKASSPIANGISEMCQQIKSIKSGELEGRPVEELIDEL